ncbi:hypothetical protein EJB05_04526, partial [Eragrostis curvula]
MAVVDIWAGGSSTSFLLASFHPSLPLLLGCSDLRSGASVVVLCVNCVCPRLEGVLLYAAASGDSCVGVRCSGIWAMTLRPGSVAMTQTHYKKYLLQQLSDVLLLALGWPLKYAVNSISSSIRLKDWVLTEAAVLFQFQLSTVAIGERRDGLFLNSSMATWWYTNPDIPEAREIQKRYWNQVTIIIHRVDS